MYIAFQMTAFQWRALVRLCLLTFGVASGAAAQDVTKPSMGASPDLLAAFTTADKDRDKSLSPFEARHMPDVASQFAKYDANRDGYMSMEEFMSAKKGSKPARKK